MEKNMRQELPSSNRTIALSTAIRRQVMAKAFGVLSQHLIKTNLLFGACLEGVTSVAKGW